MTGSSDNQTPISVVIPTYRRVSDLRRTLEYLEQFSPSPAECIVHVDAGDTETPDMLKESFPNTVVICSDERQGPGGGRNKLIARAAHETIVSLDDDSWPMQMDFFQQAILLTEKNPKAAVIGCEILESDGSEEDIRPPEGRAGAAGLTAAGGFVGCGAIVRKTAFLQTAGYLPLANAYGMEEADISLQLMAQGWELLKSPHLRIFHACDRSNHHASPKINAAQIRNTALLAFLRYPVTLWPRGILQTLNRVIYCIRKRRFRGMLTGLCSIVPSAVKYRKYRAAVPHAVVDEVKRLQRLTAESQTP